MACETAVRGPTAWLRRAEKKFMEVSFESCVLFQRGVCNPGPSYEQCYLKQSTAGVDPLCWNEQESILHIMYDLIDQLHKNTHVQTSKSGKQTPPAFNVNMATKHARNTMKICAADSWTADNHKTLNSIIWIPTQACMSLLGRLAEDGWFELDADAAGITEGSAVH